MHSLIVGRTNTGKTTLAKQLGSEFVRQSFECIAYNPLGSKDFIRPDPYTGKIAATSEHMTAAAFIAAVEEARRRQNGKPIFLMIDEGTTFFRKQNCSHEWLATRGRHHGLTLLIICQHYTQLNPVVRGQCETLYLFKCGLLTAATCADEYGEPALKEARGLKRGQYIRADLDGLTPGRVF